LALKRLSALSRSSAGNDFAGLDAHSLLISKLFSCEILKILISEFPFFVPFSASYSKKLIKEWISTDYRQL